MRIIAGKFKGLAIKTPKAIRPTEDKVRKALFDILGDIEGLSFLELFAGSGAIGWEALSRGATELVLVENNRSSLLAIKENLASFKSAPCIFYPKEADKAIQDLHKGGKKFDIIFLDPPYYGDLAKKTLQTLSAYDILAPIGLVIVQHFKKDILPKIMGILFLFKQAYYGDTILSFYKKVASSE